MSDCVFCKIVSGVFDTEILGENQHAVAFRDINPEMPVHILVVPKQHYLDVRELALAAPEALLGVANLASQVADQHTSDGSFKLLFNTGANAGQTVLHAHAHVLSQLPKRA